MTDRPQVPENALRDFLIKIFDLEVFVYNYQAPGHLAEMPYYRAYCRKHKRFFEDYQHSGFRLDCPDCLEEWKAARAPQSGFVAS